MRHAIYDFPRRLFQVFGLDLFVRKDGSVGVFELNIAPLLTRTSNIDAEVATFQDHLDAVNLLGVRAVRGADGKFLNPRWGANSDIGAFKLPVQTRKDLARLGVVQIADEANRLGGYRRVRFEDYLRLMDKDLKTTQALYRLVLKYGDNPDVTELLQAAQPSNKNEL